MDAPSVSTLAPATCASMDTKEWARPAVAWARQYIRWDRAPAPSHQLPCRGAAEAGCYIPNHRPAEAEASCPAQAMARMATTGNGDGTLGLSPRERRLVGSSHVYKCITNWEGLGGFGLHVHDHLLRRYLGYGVETSRGTTEHCNDGLCLAEL